MTKDDDKAQEKSYSPKRPRLSARGKAALEAVKAVFAPGIKPEDSAIAVLQKGARRKDIVAVTGWSKQEVEKFLDKAAVERPDFFITGDPESEDAIFKISSGH